MKRFGKKGLWLIALTGCFVMPESATAGLRWRADGIACARPQKNGGDTKYRTSHTQGLILEQVSGNGDRVACPIPVGPSFVDLGGLGHPLKKVEVRFRQENEPAIIKTFIFVNDYDSGSSCACGITDGTVAAGQYVLRSMTFDCGACEYEDSWAVNMQLTRFLTTETDDTDGKTTIKMISAYD